MKVIMNGDEGTFDGGTLLAENKVIVDYEGVWALGEEVCEQLEELGYTVPNNCREVEIEQ